jgi:hypothetical protein
MSKRRNRFNGQWVGRLTEMLESPAWRILSLSGRRILDRLEVEHAHHGGTENGNLLVTKMNFMDYGIHHDAVAPAIREVEALGFIRMKHGRGGNAEYRRPNKFFLTYALGNGPRSLAPTHDWCRIKTMEEAEAIATAARAAKDPRAVQFARARKTKHRARKPGPKPGPETRPGKGAFSGPETGTGARPGNQDHYLYLGEEGGGGRPDALAPALAPDATPADRHTLKGLMEYVANVVEEVLNEHDRHHRDARQRLEARLREQSLFDPVNRYVDQ